MALFEICFAQHLDRAGHVEQQQVRGNHDDDLNAGRCSRGVHHAAIRVAPTTTGRAAALPDTYRSRSVSDECSIIYGILSYRVCCDGQDEDRTRHVWLEHSASAS